MMRPCRLAGSWYREDAEALRAELEGWLDDAATAGGNFLGARAIIAPHAGYKFSGRCAAHAYARINPAAVRRVFVLAPSHHAPIGGCAVSNMYSLETPFYDIPVDREVVTELLEGGEFSMLDAKVDAKEHSVEMQLPYIAHVLGGRQGQYTIVPILIGDLSGNRKGLYARIFAKYLGDPQNLFVVSSDFCHWGERFQYTYRDRSCEIHESIRALDRLGMDYIERIDPRGFEEYLSEFHNTICGRNPIIVILYAVRELLGGRKARFEFVSYEQSSKCISQKDSSVSYAAGALVLE